MPIPLTCPTCGAPLNPIAVAATVTCAHCGNTLALSEPLNSAVANEALLAEVRELLQAGQKIEAVKRVRETLKLGLKESKDIVDDVQRGRTIPLNAAPPDPEPGLTRVHTLIAEGNKIEAIKEYRRLTGLGLKEAKDAVEAIEQGMPVRVRQAATTGVTSAQSRSPWLVCGVLFVIAIFVFGLILAASVFLANF